MVEVDIAVGGRSIKALIKEAPRGWSPNPPNFNAERHELDVVVALSHLPLHCLFPGTFLLCLASQAPNTGRSI